MPSRPFRGRRCDRQMLAFRNQVPLGVAGFDETFVRIEIICRKGATATEASDASGTLMYDLETGTWTADLLNKLDLDVRKLPSVVESHCLAGTVTPEGSRAAGLPAGGCVCRGRGHSGRHSRRRTSRGRHHSDQPRHRDSGGSPEKSAASVSSGVEFFETVQKGLYYQMARMLNGGLALEWVRGIVGLTWEAFYAEAATLSPPWDWQFLLYPSGVRTPYLNPNARRAWSGMSLHHKPADLLHAGRLGVASSWGAVCRRRPWERACLRPCRFSSTRPDHARRTFASRPAIHRRCDEDSAGPSSPGRT